MSNPRLTPDERALFGQLGRTSWPWFVRAWIWSLYPVALTRGRLCLAVAAGAVLGALVAILVPLLVGLIATTLTS